MDSTAETSKLSFVVHRHVGKLVAQSFGLINVLLVERQRRRELRTAGPIACVTDADYRSPLEPEAILATLKSRRDLASTAGTLNLDAPTRLICRRSHDPLLFSPGTEPFENCAFSGRDGPTL
jgi:hypothetical protein